MNKLPSKKVQHLPFVIEKPEIPEKWDYDESAKKIKSVIYKWKTLTVELAQELWIARKKLSREGRPWPK